LDTLARQDWNAAMSIRTSPWPPGVPCWADLGAPDVAAAKQFYGDVIGWTFEETAAEFGGYSIAVANGGAAVGIGPQQPGSPPAWTIYFASDDAETTATAIAEHGGTVVLPTGDVGGLGRICIAMDPTGAVFGLWQAGSHIGAGVVNEPGGITWEDLRSPDPDVARAFYTAVFGFRTDALPEAGPDYSTFSLPSEEWPLGGIGGMFGANGLPAHWVVYFQVADTDASVAAAVRGGGAVIGPPDDTPYGRMAGLTDPAGAVFWVMQSNEQPQPDRAG
jgi:predicted enzyme related to lactoylglutathione lyase